MGADVESDIAAISRIGAVPAILRTLRGSTGLRFTAIARVLPDRWVCCAVHDELSFGLKVGGELDVTTTLCAQVRDTREAVVIEHVSEDDVYCGHHTPKIYGFQSYFSVPIFRRSGEYFGTLCGLDPLPAKLNEPKTLATIKLFAELVSLQLEAEETHERARVELEAQREAAALREQFIAVLGHDVRNPLGSIVTGTEILLRRGPDPADTPVLTRIRASARRIATLMDEVLDLARGRLGGGLTLQSENVHDLAARLRHVVDEIQASHPERSVELRVDASGPVRCDVARLEQLLSNLLANAVEHGAEGTPIVIVLGGDERTFRLTVSNEGEPISAETRARLFQPYFRGGQSGRRDGLGLGLYIVSEIVRAHGGTVDVESTATRTTFTFAMPREQPASAGGEHDADGSPAA